MSIYVRARAIYYLYVHACVYMHARTHNYTYIYTECPISFDQSVLCR